MGITHATVATGTDAGTGDIHKAQWNADHAGETLVLLATSTLGADAADITITGIPSGYKDLIVQMKLRSAVGAAIDDAEFRVGSGSIDTGSHYAYRLDYVGTGSSNAQSSSATFGYVFVCPGDTTASGLFGAGEMIIADYASASDQKQMLCRGAFYEIGGTHYNTNAHAAWNQTTAIDQIRVFVTTGSNNMKAGSRVSIYGRL